ncbi:hypothetical protein [Niallia nealsonii]|uniref:Uncharacterized protein n=1 Tax=Niallia nealsonii TaxID=115979 RepID=A0A2N0Z767_9BACI|nr:hypothetical protein [Niallia nealsonii]PKG25333.1 hypothetical protein CWS01_02315 [Niallia nealsonii]
MEFTFFFLIVWLVASLFAVLKKNLTIADNTFVYLVILIFNTHYSWLLEGEWKLVEVTTHHLYFISYTLFWYITIPFVLLLFLNAISKRKSLFSKLLSACVSILFLLIMMAICNHYEIISYKNWNLAYDGIYFIVLHIIAVYICKTYRKLAYHEVTN